MRTVTWYPFFLDLLLDLMPGISAAGNTGDRRHGLAAAAADLVAKQAAGDTTGHGAEAAAF